MKHTTIYPKGAKVSHSQFGTGEIVGKKGILCYQVKFASNPPKWYLGGENPTSILTDHVKFI